MFKVSTGRAKGWCLALMGLSVSGHLHSAEVERIEFGGALYHVYRVDRSELPRLDLVWLGQDGKPLGNFSGMIEEAKRTNRVLRFVTNAGIYEKGPRPCGLTIREGKELVPLNLREGVGNFYLQPNGVFYVDAQGRAGVMESREYGLSGVSPRLATQSGPLMLRHGRMHPAFNAQSPNRRLRNAVGVRATDGQVLFVMSDREDQQKGRVTFHQFASFFLHQGCPDALYLDGDLSDMLVDPTPETPVTPNTFAAMFVLWK